MRMVMMIDNMVMMIHHLDYRHHYDVMITIIIGIISAFLVTKTLQWLMSFFSVSQLPQGFKLLAATKPRVE